MTLMFTPTVKFELPKHKLLLLFHKSLPREWICVYYSHFGPFPAESGGDSSSLGHN